MNTSILRGVWAGLIAVFVSANAAMGQDMFSYGPMTEAHYIERLQDYLQTYLEGVAVTFSVVSAYIVALHFFLRAAPISFRFFAFCFLTATLGALGLHIYAAYRLFLVLTEGLGELVDTQEVSNTAIQVYELTQIASTEILIWNVWGIGVFSYLALFIMTFVIDWRSRSILSENN